MLRAVFLLLIGAVVAGALMPGSLSPSPVGTAPPKAPPPVQMVEASAPPPTLIDTTAGPDTVIQRSPDGHFYVDAQVNGATVHFLVDTGATTVALTPQDAQGAGLQFDRASFQTVGATASGELKGSMVLLDRVSLGGRSAANVGAVIMDGGTKSLLGQSFLSQLSAVEIHGDTMVLR
ncbi:TIGR02281 family clan AA aspartic protease [Sphingomonas ginkgonis]|uniref:TIGR02281 family clan AA aspartic protease n=1 Tax=Sphingomonas ginkgonis TaxID=2315330 RepID=A0A429V6Q3_9SPHN|nr:TIGR02281 family clan AA aspartic protease [Sphingomonas ginkgonis]RST29609.1 TIGR02281 family clan AA aspartic protease [Sphingomonas ginkgonis]